MGVDVFDVKLLPDVIDPADQPKIIATYVNHHPIVCSPGLEQINVVRTENPLQVRELSWSGHFQKT
ncbi:hypothetical protein D3C73_1549930 [compost metagenome]